ncbi:GNAT domain [Trinorchestia longiramus]|nr:GNAT domain [Trinorchestia longiramus]
MDASIKIERAVETDCTGLRRMIQELADYEKMPDGPKIDSKTLEVDGFGDGPMYRCLVAIDQSDHRTRHLVGYALYHLNFTWHGRTVYMEDLYVSSSHRGKGIGTALWKNLLQDAMSAEASSCIFAVLDWNAPSLAFYVSKGAEDLTASKGYRTFRIQRDAIGRIAALEPLKDGAVVKEVDSASVASVVEAYREMAAEAGRAEEMKITEQELRAGLQSTPPWCYLLVMTSPSGKLLGFLLYCLAYSTWEGVQLYIKDVYVRPSHRRAGLGTTLLQALMKRGVALGASRCDLVLSSGQDSALEFFRSHEAVDLSAADGWIHMMLQRPHMEAIVAS